MTSMRATRLTALVLTAGIALGATAGADERSAALRREGYQAIYNLDYDRADELFRQAIAADPGDYAAYRGAAAATWQRVLFLRGTLLVDDYTGHIRSTKIVPMPPPPPALAAAFHRDLGPRRRARREGRRPALQRRGAARRSRGRARPLRVVRFDGRSQDLGSRQKGAPRVLRIPAGAHARPDPQGRRPRPRQLPLHAVGAARRRFDSWRASSASRAEGRRASGCWKRPQPVRATSRRRRSFASSSSTPARDATRTRSRSSATWNEPTPAIVCCCWRRRARSSATGRPPKPRRGWTRASPD